MTWLISEIVLFLILAVVLGLIMGWLLGRIGRKNKVSAAADLRPLRSTLVAPGLPEP